MTLREVFSKRSFDKDRRCRWGGLWGNYKLSVSQCDGDVWADLFLRALEKNLVVPLGSEKEVALEERLEEAKQRSQEPWSEKLVVEQKECLLAK